MVERTTNKTFLRFKNVGEYEIEKEKENTKIRYQITIRSHIKTYIKYKWK